DPGSRRARPWLQVTGRRDPPPQPRAPAAGGSRGHTRRGAPSPRARFRLRRRGLRGRRGVRRALRPGSRRPAPLPRAESAPATLRVEGDEHVWALGDCARVPNLATAEPDPPTSQRARRQARRLAKKLRGEPQPYRYRMLGQVATLGRYKGIADVMGVLLTGFP